MTKRGRLPFMRNDILAVMATWKSGQRKRDAASLKLSEAWAFQTMVKPLILDVAAGCLRMCSNRLCPPDGKCMARISARRRLIMQESGTRTAYSFFRTREN